MRYYYVSLALTFTLWAIGYISFAWFFLLATPLWVVAGTLFFSLIVGAKRW